jgi:hypothetical protein
VSYPTNWYQRIRYNTRPDNPTTAQGLEKQLEYFLFVDKTALFAYVVTFGTSDVQIEVFLPNQTTRKLERMGLFYASDVASFQVLYSRVAAGNLTGSDEGEANLLYNGIFNKGTDGLSGWEIESQDGAATLSVVNGILTISDTVASVIILRNTKTALTNLSSYKVTTKIDSIGDDTSILMQIGTQDGIEHSTIGVKNESIVASGADFFIKVTMTAINQAVSLSYIIVGEQ